MYNTFLSLLAIALTFSTASRVPGVSLGGFNPPQTADSAFDSHVVQPAYQTQHPKVLFDHAHNNLYTSTGRYKPFADLITNDGYRVTPGARSFSKEFLRTHNILVIVDAAGSTENRKAS